MQGNADVSSMDVFWNPSVQSIYGFQPSSMICAVWYEVKCQGSWPTSDHRTCSPELVVYLYGSFPK